MGADLALQFKARGYRPICFALYGSRGPFRDALEAAGVQCVDLNYTTRRRIVRRASFQVEMWRFLRRERVCALHLHHVTSLMVCGVAARAARVGKTLMTEHSLHQLREQPQYRRRAMLYCRLANEISVVAPSQLEYFRSVLRVPWERLHFIPNGVSIQPPDAIAASNVRRQMGISAAAFVFMYVGRLTEVKDLPNLLNAFALLPAESRSRAKLVIVGDGPERGKLEGMTRDRNLVGTVMFAGQRMDARVLIQAANGVVISSRTEGLPMTLLEAMGSSVPCVATSVGGIPDLLRDGAGLVVPPQSPALLSEAMQRLLVEPDTCSRLAEVALERVRTTYSLDAVVNSYLSLLGLPPRWRGLCE